MAARELSEIREMRKELMQMNSTLDRLEAMYRRPNPSGGQLWQLEQMALKGWLLSLVESFLVIDYKPGKAGNLNGYLQLQMELKRVCDETYAKLKQEHGSA